MSAPMPAIRFEPLDQRHIDGAVMLALTAYAHERERVPALAADDVPTAMRRAISDLAQGGSGVVAVDGDRLVGYLGLYGPYEGFWGSGTGCFAPLHGMGVAGADRGRLTSLLFQHAAERLVARGADTFAITTYHHDPDIGPALARNGFGIRNTDAIRMVDPPLEIEPTPGIDYREITEPADVDALLPLLNGLVRHLRQSPTFVAADEFTPEAFAARREERPSRFFVAYDGTTPVGYLEVTADGENVLTTAPDMRNICGAYLTEEHRGSGVYRNLLALTLATLRREGVRRIGVDFETMNPTALGFWTKHFDRYTTSFARRIDDLG